MGQAARLRIQARSQAALGQARLREGCTADHKPTQTPIFICVRDHKPNFILLLYHHKLNRFFVFLRNFAFNFEVDDGFADFDSVKIASCSPVGNQVTLPTY